MATGNYVLDKGYNAAAQISKFKAVKMTAAETVGPVVAIGDTVHGFAQYDVLTAEIARGKGASVRLEGITEAVATGAIPVGAACQLEVDGSVSAVVAASGKRIVGRCVGHPASVTGDRISMFINPYGALA